MAVLKILNTITTKGIHPDIGSLTQGIACSVMLVTIHLFEKYNSSFSFYSKYEFPRARTR